jgi:hypothetical protein
MKPVRRKRIHRYQSVLMRKRYHAFELLHVFDNRIAVKVTVHKQKTLKIVYKLRNNVPQRNIVTAFFQFQKLMQPVSCGDILTVCPDGELLPDESRVVFIMPVKIDE